MESKLIVKHSRLESFLKRNLISKVSGGHLRGVPEEFVIHYEGVIVWCTNASQGNGVLPFYACLILTNYQLLLTELPPKRLKSFLTLKQLINIESVAEIPPNFLFEPYRERAQRIRIIYYDDDKKSSERKNGKVSSKKINLMESSKAHSNFSWTSGSSSSVSESPRSSDDNFTDFDINEALVIDLFLISPLSNLHHILQVTWNKYLMMSHRNLNPLNNSADKYIIKNKNISETNSCEDGSAKYQWLLNRISPSSSGSIEKDIPKSLSKLKHWSMDCHHFSKLVWKDSSILNWLLIKLKQFDESTNSGNYFDLISKFLKTLATILHCITQDAIWKILDPLYVDIITMILSVFRRYKGCNELLLGDCCHVLFALFLMQCPTFVTRAVKVLLFNSEWTEIVSCISMQIMAILKERFIKNEICKVLFKHLYVLKTLIRLDYSNNVVEFLEKNHSDEFWYFASDTQINSKEFEDVLLRRILISMFQFIRDNIFVKPNAINKRSNEYLLT